LGATVAINGLSEKSVRAAIAELGGSNRLVPVLSKLMYHLLRLEIESDKLVIEA
jgi:hypothetical protein